MPQELAPWETEVAPWETEAPKASAKPVPRQSLPDIDGVAAVQSVFPGTRINQNRRDPNSPLGMANPDSFHNFGRNAVDIPAIPGMTFEQAKKQFEAKGYRIHPDSRDEYANPSAHATGGHWHFVFEGAPENGAPTAVSEEVAPWEQPAEFKPRMNTPATPEMVVADRTGEWDTMNPLPEGTVVQTQESADSKAYFENSLSMLHGKRKKMTKAEFIADIRKNAPNVTADDGTLGWYYDRYTAGEAAPINYNDVAGSSGVRDFEFKPKEPEGPQLSAPPPLSFTEVIGRKASEMRSSAGSGVMGAYYRYRDTLDMSPEQRDRYYADIMDQRGARDRFWNDQDNRTDSGISDAVGGFIGETVGDINPLYLVGGLTSSPLKRIGSQAAIEGITDLGIQSVENTEGLRDGIDPVQVLTNAAAGAAFQGVIGEPLQWAINKYSKSGMTPKTYDNPRVIELEETSQAPTAAPIAPTAAAPPAAGKKPTVRDKKKTIGEKVSTITKGWTNMPDTVIHTTKKAFEKADPDLAQKVRQDGASSAPGFYADDGRIHIIAENVKNDGQVESLIYHEALGHDGLMKTFRDDLDTVLTSLYEGNWRLRQEADKLAAGKYGSVYTGPDRLARLTEEVLAKRSEAGVISKGILDKIIPTIRKYGRELGLDLRYTDREVKAILADAHAMVVSGTNEAVSPSGLRYVLTTHVSPHDFTNVDAENPYGRFDHSKMGTGEGAQIYGWGTYLGENTRDAYFRKFSRDLGSGAKIGDVDVTDIIRNEFDKDFSVDRIRVRNAIKNVEEDISWYYDNQADYPNSYAFIKNQLENYEFSLQDMTARVEEAKAAGKDVRWLEDNLKDVEYTIDAYRTLEREGPFEFTGKRPKTYEVDVSQEMQDRMLLWDETLEKQPKIVQEVAKENGIVHVTREEMDELKAKRRELVDAADALYREKIEPYHTSEEKPFGDALYEEYSKEISGMSYEELRNALNISAKRYETLSPKELEARMDNWVWVRVDKGVKDFRKNHPTYSKDMQALRKLDRELNKVEDAIANARYTTGEGIYQRLVEVKGSPKAASEYLASKGVPGNKYKDGFSRGRNKNPSYNYVMYNDEGPDAPKIINKYMLEEEDSGRAGSINLDKIVTKDGLNTHALYRAFAEGIDKDTVTYEDALAAVMDRGIQPSKKLKKKMQLDPTIGISASIALEKGHQELMRVQKRLFTENLSLSQQQKLEAKAAYLIARQAEAQAELAGWRSNVGRALNFMKIAVDKDGPVLERLFKDIGSAPLSNREVLYKFLAELEKHEGNPKAQVKMTKDAFDPLLEDYFLSYQYSMMLYGMGTQVVNFVGNAGTTMLDAASSTVASIMGLRNKMAGDNRVPVRAAMYRNLAMIKALFEMQTWKDVGWSFLEGRPAHQVSKVEVGHNLFTEKFGAAGTAIDLPQKLLASSDSFWRSLLENAHLYEQAYILADKEGLKGAKLHDRVSEIIANPPEDMRVLVDGNVATIQLVDDPSPFTAWIERLKSRPKDRDDYFRRGVRFLAQMIFPFSRVTDNIVRTGIRHTPGLGMLDRQNLADWKAGGERRDKAIARQVVGGTIIAYLVNKAMAGELSGEGPENLDERRLLEASGWQPNSIKLSDGKWHSMQGLDAIQPMAGVIAGLMGDYKEGRLGKDDWMSDVVNLPVRFGSHLSQNTFAEQAGQFLQMLGNGPSSKMAQNSFIPGLATRAVPAFVRQYAEDDDGYMRDTSGSGSMSDRIEGRLKASFPGLRKTLPMRYDVFGRPVESNRPFLGVNREKTPDPDPVVREVLRLDEIDGKKGALVGPIDRGSLPEGPVKDAGRAEDVQALQKLSGEYIYADLASVVGTEEWKAMDDQEKIKLVKKIVKDQRKNAKAELFPEEEDLELAPWEE